MQAHRSRCSTGAAVPLKQFDPDLVSQLVQATRELGVEVRLNTAGAASERQGDYLLVHARTGAQEHTVEADLVVHAAGRVAEIDDLDLEVAGVSHEKEGVLVNEYLQSVTNEAVYAAGGRSRQRRILPDAGRGHARRYRGPQPPGGQPAHPELYRDSQRGLHDSPSGPGAHLGQLATQRQRRTTDDTPLTNCLAPLRFPSSTHPAQGEKENGKSRFAS